MNMKNKIKITYHVENKLNYPGLTLKKQDYAKIGLQAFKYGGSLGARLMY